MPAADSPRVAVSSGAGMGDGFAARSDDDGFRRELFTILQQQSLYGTVSVKDLARVYLFECPPLALELCG